MYASVVAKFWEVTVNDKHILILGLPISDTLAIFTLALLVLTIFISIRALLEAARANALSSLPVLKLEYRNGNRDPHNTGIVVKNIGNGTALSIKIDNYYQSTVDDVFKGQAYHYKLRFENIDILKNESEQKLKGRLNVEPGLEDLSLILHSLFNNTKPLVFHFRYMDISGTKFISKISISKQNIKVVGVPKKYNLWRKIKYWIFRACEIVIVLYRKSEANKEQERINAKNE